MRTVVVWNTGDTHVRPVGPTASGSASLNAELRQARDFRQFATIVPWSRRAETVAHVERWLSSGRWPEEEAQAAADAAEDAAIARFRRDDLVTAVASACGNDGTGDIGVVVDRAMQDDPCVTADTIIEIVREAKEDARLERERQKPLASCPPTLGCIEDWWLFR